MTNIYSFLCYIPTTKIRILFITMNNHMTKTSAYIYDKNIRRYPQKQILRHRKKNRYLILDKLKVSRHKKKRFFRCLIPDNINSR